MRKNNLSDGQRYDVTIVKLIRNNGIVIDRDEMIGDSMYFMLDYFDLLSYKNLIDEDKVYRKFWNFNDNYTKEDLNYKVAYKTLSLYAERSYDRVDIFKIDGNSTTLSDMPFLGIIQINYVYYYQEAEDSEKVLVYCEEKIKEALLSNGFNQSKKLRYRIYRSSTSGDFCLVIKTSMIQDIFKIALLLNNLIVTQADKKYKFNTYSNIGIECSAREDGSFLTFCDMTIQNNRDCRFALRFTTGNEFAEKIQMKLKNKEAIESAVGLFGRYDYLLRLTMKEFAEIYGILCRSKVIGCKDEDFEYDDNMSLTELLSAGIKSRKIKIINERALVPLAGDTFDLKRTLDIGMQDDQCCNRHKVNSEAKAEDARKKFGDYLEKFHDLKKNFFEESRAFTDINRALGEVISTYAPQGVENDSYVNWQILVSDLRVVFECVFDWEESYKNLEDWFVRKQERLHFLQDMRLIIDAVNQYYRFLQNVNMHTWQSPLYEIQTQLDAEKMMIAYREFLYSYFKNYKEYFDTECDDRRPMIYPIVYPDLSIDQACAMVVFQEKRIFGPRLLICRVPSFEYYGRMFNMVPWILHEASHSVRIIPRKERNEYLFELVMKSVFSQAIYKLLNKFSNDFGHYVLGKPEKDIVAGIVEALKPEFSRYSSERNGREDAFCFEFNRFETEMIEFLLQFFDQKDLSMEKCVTSEDARAIQAKLLCFLGDLNLLHGEISIGDKEQSVIEAVSDCIKNKSSDTFYKLLELVYNTYYIGLVGATPKEKEWEILLQDIYQLEEILNKNVESLKLNGEQRRDYLFRIRELKRLYEAWCRSKSEYDVRNISTTVWMRCVPKIREKISYWFNHYEGFVELYRILNVIFGYEDTVNEEQAARVGKDFNVLSQDEVLMLVQREATIYRETCADLSMATALGLTAFGYCREIFQTVSDTGTEEDIEDSVSTNINRFRMVAAILLGEESAIQEMEGCVKIPMQKLLEEGKEYCHRAFECAESIILKKIRKGEKGEETRAKEDAVKRVYKSLNLDIDNIFKYFRENRFYEEKLRDSMLEIYLAPEIIDNTCESKEAEEIDEVKEDFRCAGRELNTQLHIVYRIKYFISSLDLISTRGNIVVDKKEYEYFRTVYEKQKELCREISASRTCKVVSAFYNNADSAVTKSHASMLEDTLDFIQTYYYRNRFEVMASTNARGDKINWKEK